MKPKRIVLAVLAVLALTGAPGSSHAVLNAVDPGPYTTAFGNFPRWYQDTHGKALELCLSTAVSPDPAAAGGLMCVLLPTPDFDPALPLAFPPLLPVNFPDESFWFVADGILDAPAAGVNLRYVAAIEAAFASGAVVDGDQVSFARIRFFADVPVPGTYTVTHPYGVEVFEVPAVGAGREIQFTRDIGIGAPGDFTGALKGDIGPFLVRAAGTITVGTETFIGDPNVLQTVTGSPFGTNFLRVQGPDGSGIDVTTTQFTVAGKLFTAATLPTPLVVDRATYDRNAFQTQIDVFALSPQPATVSFIDNASSPWAMNGDTAGKFYGQALNPGGTLTGTITVNAANTGNSPVSVASNVTDVVSITRAEFSLATGTLTIEASSSDETVLPTLTAGALGNLNPGVGTTQSRSVSGLAIPSARITVTSSAGGSDTEDVVVLP